MISKHSIVCIHFQEKIMKTTPLTCLLVLGLATSASGYAAEQSIDSCIAAIQKQKAGKFIKWKS
jgi:hypothetical protein